MKKIYSILFATLIFSINAIAQNSTFTWAKRIGAAANDDGKSVAVDGSGNVFTTGPFNGTVDFDPGVGVFNMTSAGYDIYVSKLDAAGNFVWAKKIGAAGTDVGYGIGVDAAGNVYTTGYFQGNVDFDPGAGTFMLNSFGSDDVFISKLDGAGNFVYAKQIGGVNQQEANAIAVDPTGIVYITGGFLGAGTTPDFDPGAGVFTMTCSPSGQDVFVVKLDASGNFAWAKQFTTGQGYSVSFDPTGNIFTTGNFSGTQDFDPGAGVFNLTAVVGPDVFVSKLDISGNFIWAKGFGGNSTDNANSVKVDLLGNVYTTGSFYNTVDFDPGAGTFNMTSIAGSEDAFVSKLNSSGNFVWAKQLAGNSLDNGYSVALDASGNVYTTGYFAGTVDFDPGAGTFTLASVGGIADRDVFISKLDAAGNFKWAGGIGSTIDDVPLSITVDASNNIYVTGSFGNTADFNAGVGVFTITSNGGPFDMFVTKYCQAPDQPSVVSGSISICAGSSPVYTISSVSGATSYTWGLPGGWGGAGTSNTINPTVGSSGTISVSGVNACGTGLSQTITITVNPLPTITVNSGSICSGNSFTMVPSGANTYTFQGGSAVVSPTTTTSYTVVGTSTAGCVSAGPATSNLTVNATPTIAVNSGSICSGQSFTMVPSGANTYTFQGGSAVVSPTTNTSYTVSGTSTAGCVSASPATSNLMVNAQPTITVNSGSICSGQSFTMVPNGANTYTFSSGPVVTPTANASYSVTGTSAQGCVSASSAISNVTVNPLPTVSASTNNTLICVGQSATLTASGASTYTFNPGGAGASIVVSPTVTANYTITGTSAQGCNNSSVFTQSVSTCAGVSAIASAKEEIIIYPNPTTGDIFIKGVNENTKIEVYNILGEDLSPLLWRWAGGEAEMRLLQPPGIYFIRIGSVTKKIIKQ